MITPDDIGIAVRNAYADLDKYWNKTLDDLQQLQISLAVQECANRFNALFELAGDLKVDEFSNLYARYTELLSAAMTLSEKMNLHNPSINTAETVARIVNVIRYLLDFIGEFKQPFIDPSSEEEKAKKGLIESSQIVQLQMQLNRFVAESDERLEKINKSIAQLEIKYPTLENEVNTNLEKAVTTQSNFELKIKSMMTNADHLLGIFTAEKIGENYKKRSDTESKTADEFRALSLALMAIILVADVVYLFQGIFNGFTTEFTSTVVALSFLMYIPAIYLTKESNKHRRIQHSNSQLSTDIESVLTFISSLPEAEQLRLKSTLALILITGRSNQDKSEEEGALVSQEIVKQVLGAIKPERGN